MEKAIDYKELYEASLREKSALVQEMAVVKAKESTLAQENAVLVQEKSKLGGEKDDLENQKVKLAGEKTKLAREKTKLAGEKNKLEQEKAALEQEKIALERERAELIASLDKLRRQLFGMRSDKQVKLAVAGQLELFNLTAPESLIEQVGEELKAAIKKQQDRVKRAPCKAKRMMLPEHLERKEVILDPQGDLSDYKMIGSESCEMLVIEPMKMWVKRIVRRKWALKNNMDISKPGVIEAPAPSRTVKGGLFDESVLAFLLVNKYIYHLPLYRMKQMFTRENIAISASTLSDNVAAAIGALEPIYNALKKETLGGKYLQSDETTYKVLRSGVKGKCHNGYMWAFYSPPAGLLFFKYCISREHIHPQEMLENFHGVLQSDGYTGYDKALKGKKNIRHMHCLAHCRRKFDESAGNDLPRAKIAIDYIASMYAVEKVIREAQPPMAEDSIVFLRNKEVMPIMDKMKQWMIEEYPKVLPKSPIGKALSYTLKLWDSMYLYLVHGELQLDTNGIENAMRPIALSRKNSLFSGTHKTAQDAAMIFSLFATCKKHEVDPQNWLTDVLYKINDPEFEGKYSDLMPNRWKSSQ